eukprot:1845323-Rhodomonas_salina.1
MHIAISVPRRGNQCTQPVGSTANVSAYVYAGTEVGVCWYQGSLVPCADPQCGTELVYGATRSAVLSWLWCYQEERMKELEKVSLHEVRMVIKRLIKK